MPISRFARALVIGLRAMGPPFRVNGEPRGRTQDAGCGELSVSGSTLGCVTATDQPAPSRTGGVALDARDLTRCRRRIHLDHDPDAVGLARSLPDPALEQRREGAARQRAGIGAVIRRATGCFALPTHSDAGGARAGAVPEGAALIWGALLPAA